MAVERDLSAQDGSVAAESALPERMADDHARRTATTLVVGLCEDASQRGPHSEHVEEISAYPQPVFSKALLSTRRKIEARSPPGEDAGKRLLLLPNLFPERIGQLRPSPAEVPPTIRRVGDARLGEFLRFLHGQRTQAHGVQQLEDRGVRADA